MEEALASYAEALAIEPENADANFNAALTRLCMGDFREAGNNTSTAGKEGFGGSAANFRSRFGAASRTCMARPCCSTPSKVSATPFSSCATRRWSRRAAPKSCLRCNPRSNRWRPLPGVSACWRTARRCPISICIVRCLSLPLAFGTELATVPANIPYLRPLEERMANWRQRLPENGRLRIGICWAGNSVHLNDRNRSMPLERFADVLSVPGLDFISVQKEVSEAQAAILSEHGVTQLGQEFADFADTAAVVAMLDLVIAVDTSVAHLAGAMGKAVALLVPFSPDCRWLLDRTDSPWYPTMRLFRQTAIGDWDGPLERLRQELADVARRPRAASAMAAKACG